MGEKVNETPTGNNPSTTRPGLGNNTNFTTNIDSTNRNTQALGNTQVSSRLEQKIEKQVRTADKNIDEIFVSVNKDFFNQMTNYTNTLENGQNRDGIDADFTDTIRNFFNR